MADRFRLRCRDLYIAAPWYDWTFFLLPPVVALGLGVLISDSSFANDKFELWGDDTTWSGLLIGVLIHAHLVSVVFRSHGNPAVFQRYRARFVLVPIALYAAMMSSAWVLISVSVLATFWDVYHSGLQTFGFARLYDNKQGNAADMGRRLDWWLNHLLYAGPILAGVTLMDHVEDFGEFEAVGASFLTAIPPVVESHQGYLTWPILGLGALFLVYYLVSYWRLAQRGYQVSWLKAYLLVSTGLCSIYTWGFNTWGEAFLIMNLFHAVQYLGLVWLTENKTIMQRFRLQNLPFRRVICMCLFLGLIGAYGFWVETLDTSLNWLWGITLLVSIMHFWYDGFIWSVSRRHVSV